MAEVNRPLQYTAPILAGHLVVFLATCGRLLYRRGSSFFWWDDGLAIVCWFGSLITFGCICLPTADLSVRSQNNILWLTMTTEEAVLWIARISIVFAISRLDRNLPKQTKIFRLLAILLAITGSSMLIISTYLCAVDTNWVDIPNSQCPIPPTTVAALFTVGAIVDFCLMMSPFYVTKHLRDPVHKSVIRISYSCTMWIIAVTSVLTFERLKPPPTERDTVISLENASIIVAVFACNLPVVLGYIHRKVLERHLSPSRYTVPDF